jgi:hypothetical protein
MSDLLRTLVSFPQTSPGIPVYLRLDLYDGSNEDITSSAIETDGTFLIVVFPLSPLFPCSLNLQDPPFDHLALQPIVFLIKVKCL